MRPRIPLALSHGSVPGESGPIYDSERGGSPGASVQNPLGPTHAAPRTARYDLVRAHEESNVLDVHALRMREATIAVAVPMTFGVGLLGMLYCALTWNRPHRSCSRSCSPRPSRRRPACTAMRKRIVRSRWREVLFLSWTLSDLGMS